MRILVKLMFLLLAIHLTTVSVAADRGTPEEAIAMVQKTIDAMKKNGVEKTIADINNFSPEFKDRDLYISVMDSKGLLLAHGANKRMQGIDITNLKDMDGKFYVRDRLTILKSKDQGWQDYKFVNPVTKQIEKKSMYFQKYQDLIISCGVYAPI